MINNIPSIAIIGAPGSGKTTLANNLSKYYGLSVLHTDDFKHHRWAWQPILAVREYCNNYNIIEGVTVARMLRSKFIFPDYVIHLTKLTSSMNLVLWKQQNTLIQGWRNEVSNYSTVYCLDNVTIYRKEPLW